VYTNNAYAIDGCATFFKRSRFSLVKKYEVEFNKAALSLAENIGPEQKKPALSRLLKVRMWHRWCRMAVLVSRYPGIQCMAAG
jgi:hypothetical protein